MAIDVSVVIPTYNKRDFLELTLRALSSQTYSVNRYEVIIINDGSTDQTEDLVLSLPVPYEINYTRQENQGRSAARNRGLERARGETIIFLDDDCVPVPAFIEEHMQYHHENDNYIVGGYKYRTFSMMLPDYAPLKETLMATLEHDKTLHHLIDVSENTMLIHPDDIRPQLDKLVQLSYAGERERWEQAYQTYTTNLIGFMLPWLLFTTGNVSLKKSHCVDVGSFDENFKGWGLEDYEMGYRLYKHGLRFVLNRKAITYRLMHSKDSDGEDHIASMIKNYIYFCQKHPHIEIYLHWRLSTRQLDIHTYNLLVQQYYDLGQTKHEIIEDYYHLAKHQCEHYGHDVEYRRQKITEKTKED